MRAGTGGARFNRGLHSQQPVVYVVYQMPVLQRAYKFRLYPTPAQVAELSEWERQLRRLYNAAHEQRLASLLRPLRPKDWGGCRSCGAPADADKRTAHTAACAFVDYYRQNREMTPCLADDQLARVVWSARQEVLRDLEKAWQRWRKGLGGKPRFKRRTDHCRVYIAPDNWRVEAGTLAFRGMAASVGEIKVRQDRPWPGDAKFSSCHVVRDVGEWYAVFPLEFTVAVARPKGGAVGINRGAVHTVADSNGRVVDSPRYYAKSLAVIQRRSRQLARKVKSGDKPAVPVVKYRGLDPAAVGALAREIGATPGRVVYEAKKRGGLDAAAAHLRANPPPPARQAAVLTSEGRNRERAKVRLALAHQTVRRRREWFLHNESAYYARTYSKIAIEDWSTKDMTSSEPQERDDGSRERLAQTRGRNRSILDVGWYEFGRQIEYKAQGCGGEVLKVDPGLRETSADSEVAALATGRGDGEVPLSGEAGISGTCAACGAPLPEPASGRREAYCSACSNVELGDVNAAKNVLLRALFPRDGEGPVEKKKRVSIGIKGKKRKVTA